MPNKIFINKQTTKMHPNLFSFTLCNITFFLDHSTYHSFNISDRVHKGQTPWNLGRFTLQPLVWRTLNKFSSRGQGRSPLTPKIPSIFLPIFAVSDLLGGIHFFTKKSMRTWGSNHRILMLPCWTSTSQTCSSFHGI
jgi:hypothetical protein